MERLEEDEQDEQTLEKVVVIAEVVSELDHEFKG